MPTLVRNNIKGDDEIRLEHVGDHFDLVMLSEGKELTRQICAEASHPEMALEYYESLNTSLA